MSGRAKRWVVRPGDGTTIAEIVSRAGETDRAFIEGRVFLGRRRIKDASTAVKPGDEVSIGRPASGESVVDAAARGRLASGESVVDAAARGRLASGESVVDAAARGRLASGESVVGLIFARDGLVAVSKPAGLVTVPDRAGASESLLHHAARLVSRDPAELRVTSRLDRGVSGVVLFATDAIAEARLLRAREEGAYVRRYVAIAIGTLGDHGVWDAPIGNGKDALHRAVNGKDPKPATTRWRCVARASAAIDTATRGRVGSPALLAIAPATGRMHQIRVHASHAGVPLLGDRDYKGPTRMTLSDGSIVALSRIALHCAWVSVPSESGEPLVVSADVPDDLARIWIALGGAREAWDRAASCEFEASSSRRS